MISRPADYFLRNSAVFSPLRDITHIKDGVPVAHAVGPGTIDLFVVEEPELFDSTNTNFDGRTVVFDYTYSMLLGVKAYKNLTRIVVESPKPPSNKHDAYKAALRINEFSACAGHNNHCAIHEEFMERFYIPQTAVASQKIAAYVQSLQQTKRYPQKNNLIFWVEEASRPSAELGLLELLRQLF